MSDIAVQAAPSASSKGLHIGLWVVQALLAVAFGMAGLMKSFAPVEELAANMPWVARSSEALVRFIGVSELAGALGLILPALLRIKPVLTPAAAAALVVVMILAGGTHVMNSEPGVVINIVLGALAAFVAWGRFAKAPISPRA